MDLVREFGRLDIYLFDQLLRGRITTDMRVLDAGCGTGRNLTYFLRTGFDVCGADENPHSITAVRDLAARLAPRLPAMNFRAEPVEAMSFPDHDFDAVVSNAVLHFARDDEHFWSMLRGSWRTLRPGGLFFSRLASSTGIEDRIQPLGGRRFLLPDGSERYLVDEAMLAEAAQKLGGALADPLKTTLVHGARSMTTWVLRRQAA